MIILYLLFYMSHFNYTSDYNTADHLEYPPPKLSICLTPVVYRRAPPQDGTSAWLCRIKLKRERDSSGEAPSVGAPLEQLFCTITHPEDVGVCVAAAQAILLNPVAVGRMADKAKEYEPVGDAGALRQSPAYEVLRRSENELAFTDNSVVLEIEGASADLTIVDLPGIIQNHSEVSLNHLNILVPYIMLTCIGRMQRSPEWCAG